MKHERSTEILKGKLQVHVLRSLQPLKEAVYSVVCYKDANTTGLARAFEALGFTDVKLNWDGTVNATKYRDRYFGLLLPDPVPGLDLNSEEPDTIIDVEFRYNHPARVSV
jgi:hypothetical protein